MARLALLIAASLLVACGGPQKRSFRSFDHPGVQALFQQSVPSYYATVTLARTLGGTCPRYDLDDVLLADLDARREAEGRGPSAAILDRAAIEVETDVSARQFQVKHAIGLGRDPGCAAIDRELIENTALSALLVPGGS